MRKLAALILIILGLTTTWLTFSPITYARSGCCSHHGGVCGCGCCDGTGLSATCAPYYPRCNSSSSIKSAPTVVPTKPKCAANSYYNSADRQCYCNSGYCINASKSGCVLLPANARCVDSTSEVWQCNYGYEEQNGYCTIIKAEPKTEVKGIETTTEPKTVTTDTSTTTTPIPALVNTAATQAQSNNEDGVGWAVGLMTLGGLYAGKKYLDKKKNRNPPKV